MQIQADENPHVSRIALEHNYCDQKESHTNTESSASLKEKRKLPEWMKLTADEKVASESIRNSSPDGVFNYASAVLNDGLIFLEFRDAIHEGDGPRIVRCWKFMLLYWHYKGHTKYAYEAVNLISAIEATASPRIVEELLWCRTVNPRGGPGNNIPVDLFLEHLNRTLKDCLNGLGPNISEGTIVQASKSIRCLHRINSHFDDICEIKPTSMHHTKASSKADRDKIIHELTKVSNVFDYTPGRFHHTFKNISPHVSSQINIDTLMKNIKRTKSTIAQYNKLKITIQS